MGHVGATSNGQMPELQLRDCFIQQALVSRAVHPALENSPLLISQELAREDTSPCTVNGWYRRGALAHISYTCIA
jgi:hypothetical protein